MSETFGFAHCIFIYPEKSEIVLDTRHGETFLGDVLNSTLSKNERLRNAVDEIIYDFFIYFLLFQTVSNGLATKIEE